VSDADLPPLFPRWELTLHGRGRNGGYIYQYRDPGLGVLKFVSAVSRRSRAVVTYRLDDDPDEYPSYDALRAAYYRRHPERLDANRRRQSTENGTFSLENVPFSIPDPALAEFFVVEDTHREQEP
jgi:hypothetical protein